MEETENKKDFKKWLEYLQQESWQLELIISSILLVVLTTGEDGINNWMLVSTANGGQYAPFLIFIPVLLYFSLIIAKTNLVVHIFLRGFWIGCIGLRYVSNEIDIDSLGYTPKFSNYLKSKGLDFDKYLENLEKVCSIIFSFTFLLIFSVFSIFMFMIFLGIIRVVFDYFDSPVLNKIRRVIQLILGLSAFLSFIDYILLGYFKRKKYLAIIFYPFYRLYNFFSFSFIYRPLYYNFIDNPFGRKYLKMVVPYIFLLTILGDGLQMGEYKFMPEQSTRTNWIRPQFYEDKFNDDYMKSGVIMSIPSIEIKENFLPLYLRYEDSEAMKKTLEATCPSFDGYERWSLRSPFLEGAKNGRPNEHQGYDGGENVEKLRANIALECVSKIYDLKIDTVAYSDLKFHFYEHPVLKSKGILTYLNIENLEKGNHTLFVSKKVAYKDSAFVTKTFEIPFVKYN